MVAGATACAPDRIVWVRPRDPWMLNRAVVQPDPVGGARARGRHHGRGRRRRVARRSLPAPRSRRRDAPDRPGRRPHDGQDADPRRMGARPAPHHRARRSPRTHQARDPRARSSSTAASVPLRAGLARRALRRLRAAVPAAGPDLGPGQDPAPDDPGRLPVLLRRAGRLRGGDPRRRPRAQPAVPAQPLRRQPRRLGADAGAGNARRGDVRRRAGHRRLGQRLRPEPRAHRARRSATTPRCRPRPRGSPTSGNRASHGSRSLPADARDCGHIVRSRRETASAVRGAAPRHQRGRPQQGAHGRVARGLRRRRSHRRQHLHPVRQRPVPFRCTAAAIEADVEADARASPRLPDRGRRALARAAAIGRRPRAGEVRHRNRASTTPTRSSSVRRSHRSR